MLDQLFAPGSALSLSSIGLADFALGWSNSLPTFLAAEPTMAARWATWLYNILLVALGLGFVIFVHELGHFLAAKLFGVKCEKFYVGFDVPIKIGPIRLPSKLVHFQWGETEYGIGAIPLGGYVKMLGQEDDPRRAEEEARRIRLENPDAPEGDLANVQLDPRSYPAKSVGARMAIISAGVVMNLISGVLMAAWAFGVGVPFEPSVIGEVNPGDPAWKSGIRPGDQVTKVGKLQDKEMSFRDMFTTVLFHGLNKADEPIELGLKRDAETIETQIVGTTAHSDPKRGIQLLMLGLRSAAVAKINEKAKSPVSKTIQLGFENGESLVPDVQPGDVIVGINGNKLPVSTHSPYPMEYSLNELLHPSLHETVTLQVERHAKSDDGKSAASTSQVDVTWKPIPMKSIGLRFKPGTVASVLTDSPAAKAGATEGDRLVAFNDKPIEDAFTLMLEVSALRGTKASLTLEHPNKEQYRVDWQIPDRFVLATAEGVVAPVGLELPGSGLVYSVSNVVSSVVAGSMAEKSGLAAGDVITKLSFDATASADKEYMEAVFSSGYKSLMEATAVDRAHNIQYFHNLWQTFRAGMPVTASFERDGKVSSADLAVHAESQWYWPERGLSYTPLQFVHQTDSVATALALGTGEIKRRMWNVVEFLGLLVTGKMPFKAVGGPGMIAVEATDAASKGISPLLMFLVMLSANLAIINFLPIPALDGGHMMFLTAEAIRGKPVDEALQMKLTMAGVLGLLCLMGAVIINDTINLTRMFGG
jgi:regulator of sigma E protease